MHKLAILIPVFWLLTTTPARADFDAGMAAYERGEFEVAMREWLPLAKAGDAEAQYRVGRLYDRGEGVDKDLSNASNWYGKAANQEHLSAMYNLGNMFWLGEGTKKNYAEAFAYLSKASVAGHAGAQNALAIAYSEGRGVERNDETSVYWFERSAQQGYALAQGSLAVRYTFGTGVEKDLVKAYMWDLLSLRGGEWRAYFTLAGAWFMTDSDQRKLATKMANSWQPTPE